MAGFILINEKNKDGVSMGTILFDVIVIFTRKYFPENLKKQENEIWEPECPIDVFNLLSLDEQDTVGLMAFYNATRKGYDEYKKKYMTKSYSTAWDELIDALEKDERFDASKKEPI